MWSPRAARDPTDWWAPAGEGPPLTSSSTAEYFAAPGRTKPAAFLLRPRLPHSLDQRRRGIQIQQVLRRPQREPVLALRAVGGVLQEDEQERQLQLRRTLPPDAGPGYPGRRRGRGRPSGSHGPSRTTGPRPRSAGTTIRPRGGDQVPRVIDVVPVRHYSTLRIWLAVCHLDRPSARHEDRLLPTRRNPPEDTVADPGWAAHTAPARRRSTSSTAARIRPASRAVQSPLAGNTRTHQRCPHAAPPGLDRRQVARPPARHRVQRRPDQERIGLDRQGGAAQRRQRAPRRDGAGGHARDRPRVFDSGRWNATHDASAISPALAPHRQGLRQIERHAGVHRGQRGVRGRRSRGPHASCSGSPGPAPPPPAPAS